MPRLYKKSQLLLEENLAMAMRCLPAWELAVGHSPDGRIVSLDAKDVTGQQLVKAQQSQKTWYMPQ
jgi:hypothetical protein